MPVANARMYSATPRLRAEWKTLLAWVLRAARLPWDVIDHDAPAPLSALWARDDLGLAMMCGLPFAQRAARPLLLAAPVPSPQRYGRRPVYFTDIVVRAGAPYRTLEDTFGGTVGYTLSDSLSGGVAFRAHLAPHRAAQGGPLYRRAVGNLVHARGVIEALARGDIDVGPLDSWYHDLLRQDDPAFAAQVRVIASTPARPIPPLVATAPLAAHEAERLREALQAAIAEPALQEARGRLLLAGFAQPDPQDYAPLAALPAQAGPAFEELCA
jgi:ABC-type phosphate/phosphonate transport system substrate-binding protein